ncbi:hypothetical protein FRACYDRAFT_239417 [Fragilariopsis cylindrus CCMP1102]|uniref:Uncharacterized protein n=1 Tax=Fragilariopsis cylindrus CCMP1102 TaxID=635003 RepID=A0A1E7FGB2_9STRA|nr:hypothetical protein FRACYDRAFT_239417 [Fragilariopsis cylindrus CCMP1102]|eukprot:OEU16823.1 hypothetical protein FRACYDRAFT_239417 [Fragilariopsis cylindrus CCMP1102]
MKSTIAAACLTIPFVVFGIIQENAIHVTSFHQSTISSFSPSSSLRLIRGSGNSKRIISSISSFALNMDNNVEDNGDGDSSKNNFWQQQRDLMKEMSESNEQSLKEENDKNYNSVQNELVVETAFFTALITSVLWLACDNPFIPASYLFGAMFGVAYTYGLGKFVGTIGASIDDVGAIQGAGVGQARFAFLILLLLFVGKLRVYGLVEIPSIMGFFTYQIASLSQGLKEDKIA